MAAKICDNYSTIAKECCRDWQLHLFLFLTRCSKLCYKLSGEFKHLHSAIPCIANQEMSGFVQRKEARRIKLSVPSPLHPELVKKFALFIKNFYTMISSVRYNKIVVVLNTVKGIDERTLFTDSTQKLTIKGKDID